MKITIRMIVWGAILTGIGLTAFIALMPRPVDVEVAQVTRGPLRVTVQEDGKTRIREKYVVSAPVEGRLSRIELKSGDPIEAEKSLLAVIMPSEPAMLDARARAEANARVHAAQAAVQRSESAREQAKIQYDLSKAKFDRARRLLPENAISQEEFDIVQSQYLAAFQATRTASFDGEIALFELEMAQATVLQFSDSQSASGFEPFEIFAPVSGQVLRVFQESSTVVTMGAPLLELGDPQNLEIEIDVLSTDAVRMKRGAEVTVEHWGGKSPLQARVRVVEPAAFTKVSSLGVEEQRVNVIADFTETPERVSALGDAYRVEARITIELLDDVLLVPNSALFRHQRQWHVFMVVDGRAVMQPVTIGLQNESVTQIVEGLVDGDPIIVYPGDSIQSGIRVRPVNGTDVAGNP